MKIKIDENQQCSACSDKQVDTICWATSSGTEMGICFNCIAKAHEVVRKIRAESAGSTSNIKIMGGA